MRYTARSIFVSDNIAKDLLLALAAHALAGVGGFFAFIRLFFI